MTQNEVQEGLEVLFFAILLFTGVFMPTLFQIIVCLVIGVVATAVLIAAVVGILTVEWCRKQDLRLHFSKEHGIAVTHKDLVKKSE